MDAEGQSFEFKAQIASDSLYDLSSQLRKVEKLLSRGSGPALAGGVAKLGILTAAATSRVGAIMEWSQTDLSTFQKKYKHDMSYELEQLLRKVKDTQHSVTKVLKQKQAEQQQQQQSNLEGNNHTETTPLLSQSQQVQVQQQVLEQLDQSEVDLHSALIEERDGEIAEIQRSAREINAIFQDLSVLVREQGQQLDSVEDNIADLTRDTELAGNQLVRAENYQRSKGKYTCMFLCFILVLTILIAISILA